MTASLQTAVHIYQVIREQLLFENENLSEDDQTLVDTMDGLTDLHEQVAALVRDSVRAKAMAAALKIIIEDNFARKQRFEAKAERLRALALWAMQEADLKKIESPDLTITLAKGMPSVVIADETLVPDDMMVIKKTPNKQAIKEKLESGEFISYASLSNVVPILKARGR